MEKIFDFGADAVYEIFEKIRLNEFHEVFESCLKMIFRRNC